MLSIGKVGVAHAAYYLSRSAGGVVSAGSGGLADYYADSGGLADYYADSGEQPGVWAAAGAMGVDAGEGVTAQQLKAMLAGRNLDTGEPLGRKINPGGTFTDALGITRARKPVGAYDLTFSLPKSLSAAWALADEPARHEIEAAWSVSVQSVISYVQANAVSSRSGAGGKNIEEVPDGAAVARFDHYTSRAGDPQLHSHLLLANRVLCGDGVWRTLDGRRIYASAKAASMVGGAVLRAEVSRRLGWSWDRIDDRLHADVAGSPEDLIEAWSSRRRDVAKEAGQRVRDFESRAGREPTAEERLEIWNRAAVASRRSKKLLPLEGDPHVRWRAEAADLGIDAEQAVAGFEAASRIERDVYDRPEFVIDGPELALEGDMLDLLVAVAEDSATSLSDVDLDAVVYAAVNAGPGCAAIGRGGDEVVAATARALRDRVEQRLVRCEGRWWSPGLVAAEQAAAAWLGSPVVVDAAAVERIELSGLGEDQAEAAAGLIGADTAGSVLIGPAGSGKTTALAAIADAVGCDRIIAAAPTAVAAGTLGAALGTASSTVALINASGGPVPAGGWVIVDEAGQLSTRDLAALCGKAAAAGARMVLVGDPAQQGSVSAGGMFDALSASGVLPVMALNQLWRFDDPAEARATAEIHRGLKEGLDYHRERDRITSGSHADAATAAADWWECRCERATIISVPTLELARHVNAEIACRRADAQETGETVAGAGDGAIRIGDVVATRRNDRHRRANDGLPIRNGDRWVVTAATGSGDMVLEHLERGAEATVTAAYAAKHLDLGYAITQTRAQSTTVDASLTLIAGSTGRDQLYVGMSRGRAENWLHIICDQPAADPETAPAHTEPEQVIDAVFARRHGWATATDITSPAMSADEAKAHLAGIAAAPGRALPAAGGLNTAALVAGRDLAGQRARADGIDDHIADDIDDWLAGLHEADGESSALHDQEMMEAQDRLLAHIDRLDAAALSETEPAGPALGGRRPTLGAVRSARGLLHNDFRLICRQALDQIKHSNQQAGAFDNPWLIELWAMYQRADAHSRDRLAPVVAAICDPPARRRIEALTGCEPPTGPAAAWAADVRAAVAARRKARHKSALDDLAAQRAARIAQACSADLAHLAEADAARWQAAIDDWAESGCAAAHLATAWEQAAIDIAQDLFDADNKPGPASGADLQPACEAPQPSGDSDGGRADPAPPTSVPAVAALAARRPDPTPLSAPAGDAGGPDAAAVREAAEWYHQQLVSSPDAAQARAYLIGRGITEDLWAQWQLGWAPDQWQALTGHLARKGIGTHAGIAAGVLGRTRGRTWDFLRGRVVFPIRDAHGTPIALAGRTLADDGPKYLNTANTRLYNKSEALYGIDRAAHSIAATGEAVVVEGYTDVIAAHQAGIANTVAACGTALGADHLHTLHTQCGQPGLLTIALDGDAAGAKAARTIAELADRRGVHTRTVQLPDGADPADLEPDELRRAVKQTLPHPWSAFDHIAQLDRTRSYSELARAARSAVRQTAGDPTAAVLAAHYIAIAADLDLQQLIDNALPTPAHTAEPADPARTAETAVAAPTNRSIDIGL